MAWERRGSRIRGIRTATATTTTATHNGLVVLVHPVFERVFYTYDALNNVVDENLQGIRVVKSYNRESFDITFKSHGNPVYQAMWYFIAWVAISLICNGFNNLWMPIAQAYVPLAVYNLLVTFITGGVSMIIFFFVFKIIFPEGEAKAEAE